MSDEGRAQIRGFGSLAQGRGGLAWSLAGGGGLSLESAEVTATGADAVHPNSFEGWSFATELDADPLAGAAIFRHIAIEAPNGATIVCWSAGAEGIPGHGEERTSAVIHAEEGRVPYEEALISTQYDASGDPTRIGLELWLADADQTSRAAATRVSGSLLGGSRTGGA